MHVKPTGKKKLGKFAHNFGEPINDVCSTLDTHTIDPKGEPSILVYTMVTHINRKKEENDFFYILNSKNETYFMCQALC